MAPEVMRAVSPTGLHTLQFELVQVCLSQVQNVRMLKERHHQQSSSRAGSRGPLALCRRQRSAPLLGRSERPLCSSAEQAQAPLRSLACTATPRQKRRVAPISSATPRRLPKIGSRRRSTSAGPFLRNWNIAPQEVFSGPLIGLPRTGTERSIVTTLSSKALPPVEAAMRVQRWWRRIVQLQNLLFETVVKELLELRTRAAREIQRTWRGSRVPRALTSLGPPGQSRQGEGQQTVLRL